MRGLFSVAVFLAGAFLALYVGFYQMFLCGILQIIDAIKATPTDALGLVWGALRITFAGVSGWCIFILGVILAKLVDEA